MSCYVVFSGPSTRLIFGLFLSVSRMMTNFLSKQFREVAMFFLLLSMFPLSLQLVFFYFGQCITFKRHFEIFPKLPHLAYIFSAVGQLCFIDKFGSTSVAIQFLCSGDYGLLELLCICSNFSFLRISDFFLSFW